MSDMKTGGHAVRLSLLVACLLGILPACSSSPPAAPKLSFYEHVQNSSITVYPVVVVHSVGLATYDDAQAQQIADFITGQTNARVTLSDQHVSSVTPLGDPQHGQWQQAAAALKAHITANPIETDFASLAAYIIPRGADANMIHHFLVNSRGDLVRRLRMDRNHAIFRDANPRTPADCTQLLIQVWRDRIELREAMQ